jgi:deazaflavin-dependent oxidoreductase (nitroreductase family)
VGVKQRILDGLRVFNKYTLNHLTRRFAGKPRSPVALVIHTGRSSGKMYETPVIAQQTADGFVIPLAYGTEADWYHNVLAAGYCRIRWYGQEYTIEHPQEIDARSTLVIFPFFPQRVILRLLGTQHFIKMSRRFVESLDSEELTHLWGSVKSSAPVFPLTQPTGSHDVDHSEPAHR